MKTFEKYISYLLVLVFPGLGHLYCGKKVPAACIALSISVLFIIGFAVGGSLEFETTNPNMMGVFGLNFIYARLVPIMGSVIKICTGALLFFPAAMLTKIYPDFFTTTSILRLDIGTAFCLTAGLLNLLTLINLFYWHNRELLAQIKSGAAPKAPTEEGGEQS